MLDRDEDMLISGGRHPFYAKYKVGRCPLLERELSAAVTAGAAAEGGLPVELFVVTNLRGTKIPTAALRGAFGLFLTLS